MPARETSARKIRWGVAGLGNIAHRFCDDLTGQARNAELYAVAARDPGRALAFAERHACCHVYGSYLELAKDANVDVVYVASIHPLHRSMVELFLSHGKHVLVEKPAFTNRADWDAMSALAGERGLLLVEAMKTVTFPAYRALASFIRDHNLRITHITAGFGGANAYTPEHRLFNSALCGGATLDVGVYALWLFADLCRLMGCEVGMPDFVHQLDNMGSRVDETVEFIFAGDVKGNLSASITRDLSREAILSGENFDIRIREKWWSPSKIDINWQGRHFLIDNPVAGGGFQFEVEHVSALILSHQARSEWLPRNNFV